MNEILWAIIIFIAMTFTMSIGSLRIIFLVRGSKTVAMIIIFVEGIIAISIISIIIREVSGIFSTLAYGAGLSLGVYFGILISERFTRNIFSVNIFSRKHFSKIKEILREEAFGVTSFYGSEKDGDLLILNIICDGKRLKKVNSIVYNEDPEAFMVTQKLESYRGRGPWTPG